MRTLDGLVKALLVLTIISSAACGSSASSRFYALSPEAVTGSATVPDLSVMIGPFEVPGYLDRPQIVTRAGDAELEFAEFDRWAEPLGKSIARTVTRNVRTLLDSDRVYEFPLKKVIVHEYQVAGRINRFDADKSRVAVLDLQWTIIDERENKVVGDMHFSRYEESTGSGSYEEIVLALNRTLTKLSQDIADSLRSLSHRETVIPGD